MESKALTEGRINTLGAMLRHTVDRCPNRLVFVSDRERHSYQALWERAMEYAAGLKALGVQGGDNVGILMPNTFEFVAVYFATTMIGAVAVPLNTRYNAQELRFVIGNAEIRTLCVMNAIGGDRDLVERLGESFPDIEKTQDPEWLVLSDAPKLRTIVSFDKASSSPNVMSEGRLKERAVGISAESVLDDMARVAERDASVICYTSGSTANPKGCVISHHSMVFGWGAGANRLGITEDDLVWAPCPLYHLSSLGPLTFVVEKGATLVTQDYFEPSAALALLRAEQPPVWYTAVTSIPSALFELPEYRAEDFSQARFMINAGPPDILQALQGAFAGNSITSYGMTEAAGLATVCSPVGSLEDRTCNVGKALEGMQVRIVDPATGKVAEVGEPGEIQFYGTVFDHYYGNPEATALTKDAQGWCSSGDVGRLSADGTLTYLSRLKDMLKVGGENVAPVEVEQCLSDHPAVKLVQVVGASDSRMGEVPVAFVEIRPGMTTSEAELLEHCEGRLARFKRPREIRFITEWPQSITLGKIQKKVLREMLEAPASMKEMDNANQS